MIKVWVSILVCILVGLCLSACQTDASNPAQVEKVSISPDMPVIEQDKALSKEQVMLIFSGEEKNRNNVITDCVVALDGAYGLTGVVQYTDENGNTCCLAFVKDTWSYPIGLDADNLWVIAEDSVLAYQGKGIVTLSLKNPEKDEVFDYTVAYSCNDANTHFEVSSSLRN